VKFLPRLLTALELAAIDRHADLRQQAHPAAQRDKVAADLANGPAIVLAEVGNGLVIWREPAGQPHHFDIASSLALKPPARLNPVEITVDVQFQQNRRMICRPAGRLGTDTAEPKFTEIKLVDESLDYPDGIVLIDPIVEAFGEKGSLAAIRAFNKASHPIPRKSSENHIMKSVFTQPGPKVDISEPRCLRDCNTLEGSG